MRLSRDAQSLRTDLDRDWPALLPTVALVNALARRTPDFPQDLDVARAILEAKRAAATQPTVRYPGPWASGFPSGDELERDEAALTALAVQVGLAELALCVLRTWVARWWYAHGEVRDDVALQASLTEALDAHRVHRAADKAAQVMKLEGEARAKLEALDERTLLCDRASTACVKG
jgi:hypothetical protein